MACDIVQVRNQLKRTLDTSPDRMSCASNSSSSSSTNSSPCALTKRRRAFGPEIHSDSILTNRALNDTGRCAGFDAQSVWNDGLKKVLEQEISTMPNSRCCNKPEKVCLSLQQITKVCERLLQKQKMQLEGEVAEILSRKLAEQYETFCNFTHDQIRRQTAERNETSYFT